MTSLQTMGGLFGEALNFLNDILLHAYHTPPLRLKMIDTSRHMSKTKEALDIAISSLVFFSI